MRIVVSCLQSLRPHKISSYKFWQDYFRNGILEWGGEYLEVPGVDWAEGITFDTASQMEELRRWRSRTWETTVDFILKENSFAGVDMFLTYLYPCQVERTAIETLTSAGIPCVNFFCDNVREFSHMPEEFSPFSLHWVPEFEAQELYRNAGATYIHTPMPCWVDPSLRHPPGMEKCRPSFVGTGDSLRRDLLGQALALGADFQIFGHGWAPVEGVQSLSDGKPGLLRILRNQIDFTKQRGALGLLQKLQERVFPFRPVDVPEHVLQGPILSHEEYLRVIRQSEVTIGVNRVPSAGQSLRRPRKYSRLRDLEAPMMGACYLTERCPGIELLYEPGREIECYSSAEELTDQLIRLRRDADLRRRLRFNGQKRALAEHTISQSLSKIITILN